jgi:hypothetical protein
MTVTPSTKTRRGFATMSAVLMISLLAASLATLGTLFSDQLRRTRKLAVQAQMRQLLIAGAIATSARVRDMPSPQRASWTIEPPPAAIDDARIRVEVEPQGQGERVVARIEARLGEASRTQTLVFARGGRAVPGRRGDYGRGLEWRTGQGGDTRNEIA